MLWPQSHTEATATPGGRSFNQLPSAHSLEKKLATISPLWPLLPAGGRGGKGTRPEGMPPWDTLPPPPTRGNGNKPLPPPEAEEDTLEEASCLAADAAAAMAAMLAPEPVDVEAVTSAP